MRSRSQSTSNDVPAPSPEHGVYVNYMLDVTNIDVLGLDLDHTLAVYDDDAVNAVAFRETCRNLVELKGYPGGVAELDYGSRPVARGLLADIDSGYLVKLDRRDLVRRALGRNGFVKTSTIATTYGDVPFSAEGCYQIHSPFDLPAGVLFSSLLAHSPPEGPRDIGSKLTDIVEMLDRSHRFGGLKQSIVADPIRYIERRPGLDDLIGRFRDNGKKTILLTNSGYDYAVDVLDHLFPGGRGRGGWRTLFDAVIVDADKPRYFDPAPAAAAQRIDAAGGVEGAVWRAGNARALEQYTGAVPERILYIGDNPAADCLAARARGWRTALVVPEIESDPRPPDKLRSRSRDRAESWGSLFWESDRLTRFARVLRESPDVFAARVEQILAPGPDAKFGVR